METAKAREGLAAREARINVLADQLETSGRSLREINIRLQASSDELERRTSELAAAWRANDDLRSRWRTAYGELEQRFIGQTDNIIAQMRAETDDVSALIAAVQGSSLWSFKLAVASIRPALAKVMRMLSLQRQP